MDKPSDIETALILVVDALREMNQGQRRRLLIMDSQIEALNKLAQRQEALEARFEDVLNTFKAVCKVCSRLNILCSPRTGTKDKGPDDKETLPDWH